MLLSKIVVGTWNPKNRNYYESKGYKFTKYGDEFDINVEDLSPSSKFKVVVQCDYCGNKVIKVYQTYCKQHDEEYGDACKDCQPKKMKARFQKEFGVSNPAQLPENINKIRQHFIDEYGVENPGQLPWVQKKIADTCLERYGVDSVFKNAEIFAKSRETLFNNLGVNNPFESKEIQEKIKETNKEIYGYERPSCSEIVQEKTRATNRERFGADYYTQTEEYKERAKLTNLRKFGCEYPMQNPEIRAKANETLSKNGNCKTSIPQKKLHDLLEKIYGKCELNYPVGSCSLDCYIKVNQIKIDVEYDGWYWHQDKQRDRRRDEFIKSKGYKILRIVGDKKIPTKEEITKAIDILVNTSSEFYLIDMK